MLKLVKTLRFVALRLRDGLSGLVCEFLVETPNQIYQKGAAQ